MDCTVVTVNYPRWLQTSIFHSPKKTQTFLIASMHKRWSFFWPRHGQPTVPSSSQCLFSCVGLISSWLRPYFDQDVVRGLWAAGQPTCWASRASNAKSWPHAGNVVVVLLWSCGMMMIFFFKKNLLVILFLICVPYVVKKPVNITYNLYCLLEQKGKMKSFIYGVFFFRRWIVFLKDFICYSSRKSLQARC